MREIKFRGKTNKGEWVYGDLHLLCDAPHIHTEISSYPYAGKRAFIDTSTIGQFTGLRDANGKEIYEGDIVRHPYIDPIFRAIVDGSSVKSKVVFHDGAFVINYDVDDFILLDAFIREGHVEVVGNIYDNSELLIAP